MACSADVVVIGAGEVGLATGYFFGRTPLSFVLPGSHVPWGLLTFDIRNIVEPWKKMKSSERSLRWASRFG